MIFSHEHGPQCKPYKIKISPSKHAWVRPLCWPQVLDPDATVKAIAIQKAFGPSIFPICESCGAQVMVYSPTEEEIRTGTDCNYERHCTRCLANALRPGNITPDSTPVSTPKKKEVCRYCWKPRKLIGAWCRTCRNAHQRKVIQKALDRLAIGEILTWEEEQILKIAPFWAIWKKEFKKVKR